MAAFAARLQDAVDLDSVRDDLAGVVHRALEPAHVSVWIRPARLRRPATTVQLARPSLSPITSALTGEGGDASGAPIYALG